MPSPSRAPVSIIKNTARHNMLVPNCFNEGYRFDNKRACMYAIGIKAIMEGFEYRLANEGIVMHIETDDEGCFKMCFVAFGVAIRSFASYLRPLIKINGAHLKGRYLGTNLLAVGMDANNQIIPLTMGVSQGETVETWSWFMTKLKECIGVRLKAWYWKTCKAYLVLDFEKLIAAIREVRPKAYRKLKDAGFEKWSRAYCPANRYNYMTSNSAESINSLTKTVRKVPITMLMDYYSTKVVYRVVMFMPCLELVYPLPDPKRWENPHDLQVVLPPTLVKPQPSRPKNKDRIRSQALPSQFSIKKQKPPNGEPMDWSHFHHYYHPHMINLSQETSISFNEIHLDDMYN
ncbi:transposase, MuDR, MULE transposase domain protein [Tanacetum coccineum]